MTAPVSVDAYLATLSPERRARLEELGRVARANAPGAVETIAYAMPCLRLDGRFLVSWSAFKAHDSLFPATERVVAELGEEVAPYVSGKGTLRFPAAQPLPLDLIGRIVAIRVTEHG